MRFYHYISLLFCCLASACSSSDTYFPREETLTQELMPLQGITYPMRIEVKHPFLIIQNLNQSDSLFHVYDLTNNELRNAFGSIGQGPGEFAFPQLFQSQLSDILIGDLPKNMVYRFDINGNVNPMLLSAKKATNRSFIIDAAIINDSLYCVDGRFLGPSLYLLNMNDESPSKSRQYRNSDLKYYADPDMGEVYAHEGRIVLCYGYKKQIDFMDIDLNLIKRVGFEFIPTANINYENAMENEVKISYYTSYLGKRYLYALYLGTSLKELKGKSYQGTFLEVFDLEGNPIVRYRLNGIAPVYFAVDEETFTLYGAGEDGEPEDYLLVYKLKGLS